MLTGFLSILFGVAAFAAIAVIIQSVAVGLRYWQIISAELARERIRVGLPVPAQMPAAVRVTKGRSPITRKQTLSRVPAPLFAA